MALILWVASRHIERGFLCPKIVTNIEYPLHPNPAAYTNRLLSICSINRAAHPPR